MYTSMTKRQGKRHDEKSQTKMKDSLNKSQLLVAKEKLFRVILKTFLPTPKKKSMLHPFFRVKKSLENYQLSKLGSGILQKQTKKCGKTFLLELCSCRLGTNATVLHSNTTPFGLLPFVSTFLTVLAIIHFISYFEQVK